MLLLEKPYTEYVKTQSEEDLEFLKKFHAENPCGALCRLKEKYIFPKLFKLGQKVRRKHMLVDMMIDCQARNPINGKVMSCHHQHAQSYLEQFGQLLWLTTLPNNKSINVRDTINTLRAYAESSPNTTREIFGVTRNNFNGVKDQDKDKGIVIGSGTMAVDIEDFALDSQLITNVGHGITQDDLGFELTDSVTTTFRFIRHFTNSTGATINVNEIGMVCNVGSSTFNHLLERTKLGSAFVIADAETGIVGYTFKFLG